MRPWVWRLLSLLFITSVADLPLGGLVGAPVAGVLNKPEKMSFVGSQSMVGAAMAVATLLLVMIWTGRKGWTKKS